MKRKEVIAIFDIGKSNKKLVLFDAAYEVVWEKSVTLDETTDDDGDACESILELEKFIFGTLQQLLNEGQFDIKALNISAYGASLVCIDDYGLPAAPLYNYLKSYPPSLQNRFYRNYGGETEFSLRTASPVLGSLNSGLQLYRMKYLKERLFGKTVAVLHLPQYLSFIISGKPYTEITSLGCHTGLWDFNTDSYHEWVIEEGLADKFHLLAPSDTVNEVNWQGHALQVGIGLHDSSAALIPYLMQFTEPFVLLSTGTWNISLNPFNNLTLTEEELKQDCLCYLNFRGQPVKASRLFAGHWLAGMVKKLIQHYKITSEEVQSLDYDPRWLKEPVREPVSLTQTDFPFQEYAHWQEAYHQLLQRLVHCQYASTQLVLREAPVKNIYVDGGFSRNKVFMQLMARAFPGHNVYAARVAQASALGAALVMHAAWNPGPLPHELIQLDPIT